MQGGAEDSSSSTNNCLNLASDSVWHRQNVSSTILRAQLEVTTNANGEIMVWTGVGRMQQLGGNWQQYVVCVCVYAITWWKLCECVDIWVQLWSV